MDSPAQTDKEAFKNGFLAYCKEAGWTEKEISELVKAADDPTWGQFGYEFLQNFNPWNGRPKGTSYGSVLDRWYNPWTTQQITEKGEQGLMRGGQAAMGVGAAAGAGAGLAAGGGAALLAGLRALATGGGRLAAGAAGAAGPAAARIGSALKGGSRYLTVPLYHASRWASLPAAAALGAAGTNIANAPSALGASATDPRNLANLTLLALGAPIAGGLALGGGLGYGAAKLTEPKETDDDLQAQEIEQAYKIQAKRLKARREYEQYRQARGLNG